MKKETKILRDLAKDDFESMNVVWNARRYRLAVFCAQQSVEKIIKAYIIEFRDSAPPRIHDIDKLLKVAKLDTSEIHIDDVSELSKAYTRVRYEDMDITYYSTKKRVEPLIKLANSIYLWISLKFKNQ